MTKPYIQLRWPDFAYQGQTYSLNHLDEYLFSVQDQEHLTRTIVVTFSDHCFTREYQIGDPPALSYPGCSRSPGYFCITRYACSLDIKQHIPAAVTGKVWLLKGDHFAIIPAITLGDTTVDYGIVFGLDRVKGLEGIDLHMRVKTAYPFTQKRPTTYGATRFKVLVALRMKNKYPGLNTSGRRRW